MLYIKDGKIYKTPIQCQTKKTMKIKKDTENGVEEIEKVVKVTCYTNDEKIILANGFQKYVPQKKELTIYDYCYNKRMIKGKLVELGFWQTIKDTLTADEYEDLILSEDFAFDDPLFTKCYEMLKTKIENIDDLLMECRK